MHLPRRITVSSAVAALFAAAIALPAAASSNGKIPITTSSAAARDAYLKGRDLFERLRGQEARPHFERAVAADPKLAVAWLGLANTQPSAKQFFDTLAKATAAAPGASPGEKLLIRGADAGGRGDNAAQVKAYEELVNAFPGDERALVLLGNAHFGAQRYPEAIGYYERAAKIAPSFSQIYNQLGYSHRFLGQMDRAEAAFKKYTEVLPDDPNPYDSYAELLLKLGRYDEAIREYRRALSVRSDFVNSRFGIATCLDLQGKGADARRELDAMLAQAQDDGQRRAGLFARTVSYAYESNWKAAQAEMDKQLALAEKIQDALNMNGDRTAMGDLALAAGDVDVAAEHYRQGLAVVESSPTVNPANKENVRRFAMFNRAKVALARGDVGAAKKESAALSSAVADLGSPFQKRLAHEVAGRVALAEKNWERAIHELGQSNLLDPYNLWRLSQAHAGRGDAVKAAEYAAAAKNDNTLTNLNLAIVRQKAKAS